MTIRLLPSSVRWAHEFSDHADVALFPQEQADIANSEHDRHAGFATVRPLARAAPDDLGQVSLPPGERGAPVWPTGVAGSMTRGAGYRAVAVTVAHASDVLTIGVDAEPDATLPDGVSDTIARPEEHVSLPSTTGTAWDRILFIAEESVDKAWCPPARTQLNADRATVSIAADGTFTAHILVPGPPTEIIGRWTTSNGLIATAITVYRDKAAPDDEECT